MTEKRFEIVKSKLIKDGWVINDKLKQFTFPTLKGDKRALISYCKALNELHEEIDYYKTKCGSLETGYLKLQKENEQLRQQNENLLVKLKYTCEQINYSEKLREMIK